MKKKKQLCTSCGDCSVVRAPSGEFDLTAVTEAGFLTTTATAECVATRSTSVTGLRNGLPACSGVPSSLRSPT